MFNPTTAQRVNERYRRLLLGSGWTLPESGAELTLNYDFVAQPNLDPQINPFTGAPAGPTLDITRTTTKMFTDWESVLRTVLAGEASFTGCRRVENLFLKSNDFTTTEWTIVRCSTISGKSDPDGGTNAWAVNEDGSSESSHELRQTIVPVVGKQYTCSISLKASNRAWARMQLSTAGFPAAADAFFDLTNGTVGEVGGGLDRSSIEALGDGWYRCSITSTADVAATTICSFSIAEADDDLIFTGLSQESIFVYHVQLEDVSGQADTTPSEYVDTTTVPAAQTFPLQKNGLPFPTTALGLLPEGTRTNLQVRSEEMAGAGWGRAALVIDSNVATAPDGTFTADRLNISVTSSVHNQFDDHTITSGVTHALSVYLKNDGGQFAYINWTDSGNGEDFATVAFDLSAGTVGGTDVGTDSGTVNSTSIVDVGDGWFRCTLVATVSQTGMFFAVGSCLSANPTFNAGGNVDHQSVAGEDYLMWGAQVEVGIFPSSYIPTVASTVTRNRDDIKSSDISWLNEQEGTYYFNAIRKPQGAVGVMAHVDDGGVVNRHFIAITGGGDTQFLMSTASSTQFNLTANVDSSVRFRFVGAYETNFAVTYTNGVQRAPDTSVNVATGINRFVIGDDHNGGSEFYGHMAQIRFYNKRGTLSELEDLSNGLLSP